MANLQDLGDEEFMAAWTDAGERLAAAKDAAKAFSAEHNRRLLLAEEQRQAARDASIASGDYDPSLTQTVGKAQDNG